MSEHPFQKWSRIAIAMNAAVPWLMSCKGQRPLTPRESCLIRLAIAMDERDYSTAERCQEDLVEIDSHLSRASNGV